ncbi:unnamed protein product [Clonostachys rosea f. rosea IK726]|uniref:Uncharacterized protein n=1 Tax=Clonostachys rosea f. rosea IK726 TaxID=1349383 RepID=A0ACA9UUN4_BIOOC|nr:unnamed protein product [Clonostachys rosea f. rosea IK726]
MAATRVVASRLASQMAVKAARPAMRAPVAASKRALSTASPMQALRRQQASTILNATARNAVQRRAYSSEIAQAMVEVSKNIGMGSAAIGLTGAGIGIGLVFAALPQRCCPQPCSPWPALLLRHSGLCLRRSHWSFRPDGCPHGQVHLNCFLTLNGNSCIERPSSN